VIRDAMGRVVQRHRVGWELQRFQFSTAELIAGVYHYAVVSGIGQLGAGKLTIVR